MEENIRRNHADNRVSVKELQWEDESVQFDAPFDIIIACDVVANCYAESVPHLVRLLDRCSDDKTLILVAFEKRDISDREFFRLLSEKFNWKRVGKEDLDPHWQSDDIGIFRVYKRT